MADCTRCKRYSEKYDCGECKPVYVNKAILIMDVPSGCIKCPLYDYVPSRCFVTDKFQNDISEDFKPEWCPLKPMPEKKDICGTYNGEYYAKGGMMPSAKIGYNTCIDEILGV